MAQLELERVTDLIRGDPTMGEYSFTLNHQKVFSRRVKVIIMKDTALNQCYFWTHLSILINLFSNQ